MLVVVVGAGPVTDDECSAKDTLRLVTMFDALLEGASQSFIVRGLSCDELLWVPDRPSFLLQAAAAGAAAARVAAAAGAPLSRKRGRPPGSKSKARKSWTVVPD